MEKAHSNDGSYSSYWIVILVFLIFQYSNLYMMNVSLFSSQIGKIFWGTFAEVAETIIVVCLLRSYLKKDWRQFTTNKLRILEIILIGIYCISSLEPNS